MAELSSDGMAFRPGMLEMRHRGSPRVDWLADAQEHILLGRSVWPLDPMDLMLRVEDRLRRPSREKWLAFAAPIGTMRCRAEPVRTGPRIKENRLDIVGRLDEGQLGWSGGLVDE